MGSPFERWKHFSPGKHWSSLSHSPVQSSRFLASSSSVPDRMVAALQGTNVMKQTTKLSHVRKYIKKHGSRYKHLTCMHIGTDNGSQWLHAAYRVGCAYEHGRDIIGSFAATDLVVLYTCLQPPRGRHGHSVLYFSRDAHDLFSRRAAGHKSCFRKSTLGWKSFFLMKFFKWKTGWP